MKKKIWHHKGLQLMMVQYTGVKNENENENENHLNEKEENTLFEQEVTDNLLILTYSDIKECLHNVLLELNQADQQMIEKVLDMEDDLECHIDQKMTSKNTPTKKLKFKLDDENKQKIEVNQPKKGKFASRYGQQEYLEDPLALPDSIKTMIEDEELLEQETEMIKINTDFQNIPRSEILSLIERIGWKTSLILQ